MNVILLSDDEVSGGRVRLTDHRAKHIVKVLKGEVGDSVKIGRVNGLLGEGGIIRITKKYPFHVEIETFFDRIPPAKPPIDLLLALPRPIMLRRIFNQVASLGIEILHIIHANRVEKSFWEAGLLQQEEYEKHLIHGLEQARDTVLPRVIFHRRFKVFVEDYLPQIADQYSHFIIAHPGSEDRLPTLLPDQPKRVLFAIGPEGGWVDYEMEKFRKFGFAGFTLGERILKVDTAVVNIHGRISAIIEGL